MIVNKLGDPVKKVASKALFHLNKLLEAHPQMKIIVVSEVERLLFRNNIGKRAQYYGICFLNHIRVLGDESNVAIKLVKVYLAFFKACVKTVRIKFIILLHVTKKTGFTLTFIFRVTLIAN